MVQKENTKKFDYTEPKIIRENKEVLIERGNINLILLIFIIVYNKYLNYCGDYLLPNQSFYKSVSNIWIS